MIKTLSLTIYIGIVATLAVDAPLAFAQTPNAAINSEATSITTLEASAAIDGVTYQRIQYKSRDYFIRASRPGSALIEVSCQSPQGMSPEQTLTPKQRSKDFVSRLEQGCSSKQGDSKPERFTFEQPTRTEPTSAKPAKAQKVELLGPKSFPSDLDPHVLPDQPAAGGTFDWKERRY